MIGARTGDDRVRRLLDEMHLNYKIDGNGNFVVPFMVGEARSQIVYIDSESRYVDGLEVRHVWSLGLRSDAALNADLANALLVYNANVHLGAWQLVRHNKSGECTAIFVVPIAADTTTKALRSVMNAVGLAADDVEGKLSNEDTF